MLSLGIYIYIYYRISSLGNERIFVFKADSEHIAIDWVSAIKEHIDASDGKAKNKSQAPYTKTKFKVYIYRYIYIYRKQQRKNMRDK